MHRVLAVGDECEYDQVQLLLPHLELSLLCIGLRPFAADQQLPAHVASQSEYE